MYKKSTWMGFAAMTFLFTASPLWAQETETNAIRPWWGELETGLIYDGNILQDKDQKESDIIWESIISLAYKPDVVKWSGLAIFDQYRKNTELSYSYYEVGAERPFGDRAYASLFLHVSPTAPLDKEDPNRPDRAPFSLGSHGISLSADRDSDNWGNMGFEISYTRLDYDAPFDAKDTHIITLKPSHFYRVNDLFNIFTEYSFEIGRARGGTVFGGTVNSRQDDISYNAYAFSLKLTHLVSRKTKVRLRYKIRRKRFTANADDILHDGRKDTNRLLYAQLEHNLRENIQVLGRIDRLWRRSSDSRIEFSENRLMLSAAYLF